jgi:flagellar biosynthetic protein FliR
MTTDLASWTLAQFIAYGLMLVRVSVVLMTAPVLGNTRIPPQVKAGFALVLTLLLYLASSGPRSLPETSNVLSLAAAIGGEIFAGLIIGYTAYLLFSGIQMAGQIIDIQVGFGLVNVIDPAGGQQVSILGQFYYLVALMFFLAVDGHHALIKALGDSFSLLPAGSIGWLEQAGKAGPLLGAFFTKLFIIAFQVAAPSVAVLFLTNLTMGLLSRTLPQMNVFIVGLPLNIVVGLMVTIGSLKLLGTVLTTISGQVGSSAFQLLRTLAH